MKTDKPGSPPAAETLEDCRRRVAELESTAGQLARAEEALSDAVWQWQSTFDAIVEGVCLIDPGGKILKCNRAFLSLVGLPMREVVGSLCSRVVHGCDEPPACCPIPLMKGTMTRAASVYQIRDRWFRVTVDPILDVDERVTGAVHLFTDVHDQKIAELRLLESERVLSTLMGNLPGMAYRCRNDRDWTMAFVSEGCLALTGHDPKDLLDNAKVTYNDLIHPDDRTRIWDEVQAAVNRRVPFQLSYRITPAGGGVRDVWEQGRGIFTPGGELQFLEGFITDVTARRDAERRLQEREDLYRSLIEALPHAVAIVQDGVVVFANGAAAGMFAFASAGELVGLDLKIGAPGGGLARVSGYVASRPADGSGAPGHYFTHFTRNDGVEFPAEVFVKAVTWDGRPAEQVIAIDVSQRRDLGR